MKLVHCQQSRCTCAADAGAPCSTSYAITELQNDKYIPIGLHIGASTTSFHGVKGVPVRSLRLGGGVCFQCGNQQPVSNTWEQAKCAVGQDTKQCFESTDLVLEHQTRKQGIIRHSGVSDTSPQCLADICSSTNRLRPEQVRRY